MSESDEQRKDPKQRRLFGRILDLVKRLDIFGKIAMIKNISFLVKKDIEDEDKKNDN